MVSPDVLVSPDVPDVHGFTDFGGPRFPEMAALYHPIDSQLTIKSRFKAPVRRSLPVFRSCVFSQSPKSLFVGVVDRRIHVNEFGFQHGQV